MNKKKLLLMTLLVFVLSIALMACGKDDKNDKDDDETKAPKATVTAEADNEEATKAPEETTAPEGELIPETTSPDSVAPVADGSIKSVLSNCIDASTKTKYTSVSALLNVAADVTYSGQAMKADGNVKVDITLDPLAMKVTIDAAADAAGQNAAAKSEVILFSDANGKWWMAATNTQDPSGYSKIAFEKLSDEEGVDEKLTQAAAMLKDLDLSSVDTTKAKDALDGIESLLADVTVAEEGDNYVLKGQISEEMINQAVAAAGQANATVKQYASLLPTGYGGIDVTVTFGKTDGLFKGVKLDLAKLADAFSGTTGSKAEISLTVDYNNAAAITVPENAGEVSTKEELIANNVSMS